VTDDLPDEPRFVQDVEEAVPEAPSLPDGWTVEDPGPGSDDLTTELVALLRSHEEGARGWASAGEDDIVMRCSPRAELTHANLVLRDPAGVVRAWGSAQDRAVNRMIYDHVVARDLEPAEAEACSAVLLGWAEAQARALGEARELEVQQIDAGAFADDERQHRWFAGAGYSHTRTWWQMSRPVTADEADLVEDPVRWEAEGVVFRLVDREGSSMPDEEDLRAVHDVLESAFLDHFNSREESFAEFLHRLREDPGHRWHHWWLAELEGEQGWEPAGALVGTVVENDDAPNASYVDYIGVLGNARGRGVGKGLLRTVIADAARRGRDRVGLEVDADSPTGADGLYTSMGWETKYRTQSWHRDVRV
jgi:ribosomal protein S18 acetylase RimI-like enzyme